MSNQTLHIDQLLDSSFAGFTPVLPALAWEGIASGLDKKSNKRGIIWWQAAAVTLIVSGAFFTVFQLNKTTYKAISNSKTTPAIVVPDSKSSNSELSGKSNAQDGNGGNPSSLNNENGNLNGQLNIAPFNTTNSNPQTKAYGVEVKKGVVINPDKGLKNENKEISVESIDADNQNIIATKAFEIRESEIQDADWNSMSNRVEKSGVISLKTMPVRPFVALGGHFMFGLGVGQVISNTGYSINNKYASYVHPFYQKHITQGEGLLNSMSFNATLAYRLPKTSFSIFTGSSFFQRKNSQDFNFPLITLLENRNNTQTDKFGNYPWGKTTGTYTVFDTLNYKGTSTFSQIEIPLGVMYEHKLRNNWSIMPTFSGNVGFITQKSGNTLDYHTSEVTAIKSEWYRKNYLSMNGTLGIYKSFGYGFKLGVSASGNYMLTPMYIAGATIRPRAFTGGLSTQLIWRID